MIQKLLFSQPRPSTEHNPYTRLETQFGVKCDFYQFIHIEGLEAREFRHLELQTRSRALLPYVRGDAF